MIIHPSATHRRVVLCGVTTSGTDRHLHHCRYYRASSPSPHVSSFGVLFYHLFLLLGGSLRTHIFFYHCIFFIGCIAPRAFRGLGPRLDLIEWLLPEPQFECFPLHKALHMVMVMSTAGRRGKWKASRGSSMESSIVHYLSIFFSSLLWKMTSLYICSYLCFTSCSSGKGTGLRPEWTLLYFISRERYPYFLPYFDHFFPIMAPLSTYLLLTGPCHTLGFPCMSQVPHPSILTFHHFSRLHGWEYGSSITAIYIFKIIQVLS